MKKEVILVIENLAIEFGPEGRIIVDRGDGTAVIKDAQLILDDAEFTVIAGTSECMWKGIQVYGFHDLVSSTDVQGKVVMENSVLEHAHVGIYSGKKFIPDCRPDQTSFSGGVIQLNGGNTLTDNGTAVEYAPGYSPAPLYLTTSSVISGVGTTTSNPSLFQCTGALRDPIYENNPGGRCLYFMKGYRMNEFQISGEMNFENNGTNPDNNGTVAIHFNNNCRFTKVAGNLGNLTFNHVNRAVEVLNNNFAAFGANGIFEVSISNCHTGVMISGQWTFVERNLLDNPVGINSVAIFNRSPGSTIRDNQITDYSRAINILHSGENVTLPARIIKNFIYTGDTEVALSSGGDNFNTSWWCNELYGYGSNGGAGMRIFDFNSAGWVRQQGDCPSSGHGGHAAGNGFHLTAPDPTVDIDNASGSGSFYFEYIWTQGASSNFEPDVTNGDVTVTDCPNSTNNGYQAESTFCNSLTPADRHIAEILAERDTITDTLRIGFVNTEAIIYYNNHVLIDSAI